jgi:outer membrane protein OmpA-like peptidoglycan-associated protein
MIILLGQRDEEASEAEESGYLASASDLMVGLLFVFIIMVVILSQRVEEASNPDKPPLGSIVGEIGQKMRESGVPVEIDPAAGVITLPADTLFPVGVAVLSSDGEIALNRARAAINEILPCYIYSERHKRPNCPPNPEEVEIETILIEGHTDSKPLQKDLYTNWHLGLDRARAVYERLTVGPMLQYSNERQLGVVGISSYADKRPNKVDPHNDAKNRRVELRFVLAFKQDVGKRASKVESIGGKLQDSIDRK